MAKRRPTPTSTRVSLQPVADAAGWRPDKLAPVEPTGTVGEKVKIISWGGNNMLPQDVIRIVYDSGTAEACIDKLALFIGGDGFTNQITAETRANEDQTLNQLLAEASYDLAFGFGAALIVRYTYGGEIGEVFVEEAGCVRKEKDGLGRWVVNYGLNEGKMNTADNRLYMPFDPKASKEELAEQVLAAVASPEGYWGHLYFAFTTKTGRQHYPVPSYYSGKEDLETDAAIAKYDLKNTVDGFFPDAYLTVVGPQYRGGYDEDFKPGPGETPEDAPWQESEALNELKETLKGMKGSKTGASIGITVVDSKDEIPDLQFFENGPNSKNMTDMVNRIVGKVCRLIGVPPVLIGVQEPGMLGNNQQIVNSIKLFGLVVKPRRKIFTEALAQLFPGLDLSVTPLDPVDYIDPAVIAKMTDDEIRALRGLPPLEKPQDTEAEKTLKALNGLSPLVANKVLEKMTDEEVRSLIGLPPAEDSTTPPTPTPESAAV